jgi:hypothetical protein
MFSSAYLHYISNVKSPEHREKVPNMNIVSANEQLEQANEKLRLAHEYTVAGNIDALYKLIQTDVFGTGTVLSIPAKQQHEGAVESVTLTPTAHMNTTNELSEYPWCGLYSILKASNRRIPTRKNGYFSLLEKIRKIVGKTRAWRGRLSHENMMRLLKYYRCQVQYSGDLTLQGKCTTLGKWIKTQASVNTNQIMSITGHFVLLTIGACVSDFKLHDQTGTHDLTTGRGRVMAKKKLSGIYLITGYSRSYDHPKEIALQPSGFKDEPVPKDMGVEEDKPGQAKANTPCKWEMTRWIVDDNKNNSRKNDIEMRARFRKRIDKIRLAAQLRGTDAKAAQRVAIKYKKKSKQSQRALFQELEEEEMRLFDLSEFVGDDILLSVYSVF